MFSVDVLTNLLYPPACLLCHTPLPGCPADRLFCERCAQTIEPNGPPVCARCGAEIAGAFDAVTRCARCRERPPAFDAARAPWRYADGGRHALRQFKYHGRWRIGRWLAHGMTGAARRDLPVEAIDLVVPVPRHWIKIRLRGGAPACDLARRIAWALGAPCRVSALRQVRWTRSQTRLPWRRRVRNVRGAFAAAPRAVRGRTILLVDDVVTSGATAHACAHALNMAGAQRVFVLSAARTPLGR